MTLQFGVFLVTMVVGGATAFRRSPLVLRITVLSAVLIPYDSVDALFGTSGLPPFLLVHPVTWLVLVAGLRAVLIDPVEARRLASRCRYAVAGGLLLAAAGVYWTLRARGHVPGPILIDQVVVPLGVLLWIRSRIDHDAAEAVALPRFFVAIGCAEAALALVGSVLRVPSVWGISTDFNRQAATLNGPLALALLLVTCLPLTVAVRSPAARFGAMALLLGGILTTQSRSGLVLGVLAAAFVLLAGRASVGTRVLVILLLPIAVGAVLQSSVVAGVASRFADDLGSAALRSAAADYFWDHLGTCVLQGEGVGSSYGVAAAAGLQSSFENAFYMYVVDFGLIVTIAAFGLLLSQVIIGRKWRAGLVNGGVAATVVAFALAQGYSSIATQTAAGVVLWSAVALGAQPAGTRRSDTVEPTDPVVSPRPRYGRRRLSAGS